MKTVPRFSDYIFGSWWDKEKEIDIAGLDVSRNRAIFGEVKWGNSPEKKYLLIGKKVGGRKKLIEDGYLVIELVDIINQL